MSLLLVDRKGRREMGNQRSSDVRIDRRDGLWQERGGRFVNLHEKGGMDIVLDIRRDVYVRGCARVLSLKAPATFLLFHAVIDMKRVGDRRATSIGPELASK